jgi:hypothetical protein
MPCADSGTRGALVRESTESSEGAAGKAVSNKWRRCGRGCRCRAPGVGVPMAPKVRIGVNTPIFTPRLFGRHGIAGGPCSRPRRSRAAWARPSGQVVDVPGVENGELAVSVLLIADDLFADPPLCRQLKQPAHAPTASFRRGGLGQIAVDRDRPRRLVAGLRPPGRGLHLVLGFPRGRSTLADCCARSRPRGCAWRGSRAAQSATWRRGGADAAGRTARLHLRRGRNVRPCGP